MYTKLNAIRMVALGFILAWGVMGLAAFVQAVWFNEPFLWDPTRPELGAVYLGVGALALVLSILVGRPYPIYMGLHILGWIVLGTGLLWFSTFHGPLMVLFAVAYLLFLLMRMNPIMRWLTSLDKAVHVHGQPKQPRAASDDLSSYQHGYQSATPQPTYREGEQDFVYPQQQLPPMEQAQ